MRTLLFTVAAVAVSATFNVGVAQAENYPFCLNSGGAGPETASTPLMTSV